MMYVSRGSLTMGRETQELEQGDVLRGVLVPEAVTGASFGIRSGSTWTWQKPQLPAARILTEEAKGPGHDIRVMTKVFREDDCIVLSNSCDNYAGDHPVLLAPIRSFELAPQLAEEVRASLADVLAAVAPRCLRPGCEGAAVKTTREGVAVCDPCAATEPDAVDSLHATVIRKALALALTPEGRRERLGADAWLDVSRGATGHSKYFYMPGSPPHAFPRSEVDLNEMFAVEPSYLVRCLSELRATRLFGLAPEAARHLQRTLDFFFGRHPRDDHAWPSREDFVLKLTWLEQEIARGGPRVANYKAERDTIRKLLVDKPDPW